jgi:MarR family transcriptional regulator, organic hydroperoxide resistance regulator
MRSADAAERPEVVLNPTLDFLRLLWAIEQGLQRTSKRMQRVFGITGPQRLVLRIVGQFPGVSASELAHVVRLHPSTITGIVQRLVTAGLIDRGRDPRDNRRTQLRLKPAASRFMHLTTGTIEETVRVALLRAGGGNVRAARKVLAEIAGRLNEPGEVLKARRPHGQER